MKNPRTRLNIENFTLDLPCSIYVQFRHEEILSQLSLFRFFPSPARQTRLGTESTRNLDSVTGCGRSRKLLSDDFHLDYSVRHNSTTTRNRSGDWSGSKLGYRSRRLAHLARALLPPLLKHARIIASLLQFHKGNITSSLHARLGFPLSPVRNDVRWSQSDYYKAST
jgi:hypothetical protein